MDFNILKPKKAVEAAFEKPNIVFALVLVLLPPIASIAIASFSGILAGIERIAYSIVMAYVGFFLLAIIIFVIAWLLNSASVKGKAAGFLSALSLAQIISLAIIVLSFITFPIIVSPQASALMLGGGQLAPEAQAIEMKAIIDQNPAAINYYALGAMLVVTAALMVWGIYIMYLAVKKLTGSKALVALVITLVALFILGSLPL